MGEVFVMASGISLFQLVQLCLKWEDLISPKGEEKLHPRYPGQFSGTIPW
jgi:hypothetical protein